MLYTATEVIGKKLKKNVPRVILVNTLALIFDSAVYLLAITLRLSAPAAYLRQPRLRWQVAAVLVAWAAYWHYKLIEIWLVNVFVCCSLTSIEIEMIYRGLVEGRIHQQIHIPEHRVAAHWKFPKSAVNTPLTSKQVCRDRQKNKSASSFVRQLSTRHCPSFAAERRAEATLLLSTGACCTAHLPQAPAISRYIPPVGRSAENPQQRRAASEWRDRRKDRRTPDRYVDPAAYTAQAVPINLDSSHEYEQCRPGLGLYKKIDKFTLFALRVHKE